MNWCYHEPPRSGRSSLPAAAGWSACATVCMFICVGHRLYCAEQLCRLGHDCEPVCTEKSPRSNRCYFQLPMNKISLACTRCSIAIFQHITPFCIEKKMAKSTCRKTDFRGVSPRGLIQPCFSVNFTSNKRDFVSHGFTLG